MSKKGIILLIAVFASVVIYALVIVSLSQGEQQIALEKLGQFGDSFGIITSLFSGLAFSGLIITILLQKKELGYQREELKLTREELAKSREAQQDQVEQLSRAAKLNALCTLTQVYTDISVQQRHALSVEAGKAIEPRNKFIEQLKEQLGEEV